MKPRILAIVSMLTGLAVMALVVAIQLDPLAWTHASHPSPAPSSTPINAEPAAAPLPVTSAPPGVVELPAVRITSPVPGTKAEKKREERTLEPCSEWRDLGPRYVEDGKPQGARSVRDLC